jgi:hypothetical protein
MISLERSRNFPARSNPGSPMCPKCRSDRLRVKQPKAIEFLLVFFTGKRKYRCRDCGVAFRMTDRRGLVRKASGFCR